MISFLVVATLTGCSTGFSFLVIVLGFGDTESVHHVVVDVDEGVVAHVHRGYEVCQLFEGLNGLVVVHHVRGHTSHQGHAQGGVVPCLGGFELVPR